MNVVMVLIGIALLSTAYVDALSTTLVTARAAGPLTARIGGALSAAVTRVAGRPDSPVLALAGPFIVLVTVSVWLLLLWGGWTLVFAADADAVIARDGQRPADGWARIYFAAFTIFTLGMGDYVPNGAAWQLVTSVAVISGLGLTTLAITYLVPVVTAVTARRAQAADIDALGATASDVLVLAWREGSFSFLDARLPSLASAITLTAERHLAYPVLHYFRSTDPVEDLHVQAFKLDEAVTLLELAVPAVHQPHPAAITAVRHATRRLLRHVPMPSDLPAAPPLDLDRLREAGIPTIDDETFLAQLRTHDAHRRRMLAYAQQSMWLDHEPGS